MKKPSKPPPASGPARPGQPPPARTSLAGWTAVIGLIVVALIWIGLRPSAPPVEEGSSASQIVGQADRTRFNAGAWLLPNDSLLGFVEIPAGTFLMGSDKTLDPLAFDNERWSADRARGVVDLPVFYMARYEVTVGAFAFFVDRTGHQVDAATLRAPADHPVTMVSWPDAIAYCRWLEESMRASPDTPAPLRQILESGGHVGLPTEAQWEKSARGVDGRVFPWGNELRRDRANFGGAAGTLPVGRFACPECAFGLADMSGNVWEWTRSPYQPYPFDPGDDEANLGADALWVMRGGSFADEAVNVRATIRGGADPGARRPFIGFRVAIGKP